MAKNVNGMVLYENVPSVIHGKWIIEQSSSSTTTYIKKTRLQSGLIPDNNKYGFEHARKKTTRLTQGYASVGFQRVTAPVFFHRKIF